MINRTLKLPVNKSFFLFGPRQTGKTTLINSVFKDKVYRINLLLSDQFFKYSKDPSLLRREVIKTDKDIAEADKSVLLADKYRSRGRPADGAIRKAHWRL